MIKLAAVSHQLTSSPAVFSLAQFITHLSGSLYSISKSIIFHPSADSISRETAVIRHAAHKGQTDTGGSRIALAGRSCAEAGRLNRSVPETPMWAECAPRRQTSLLKVTNQRTFNTRDFFFFLFLMALFVDPQCDKAKTPPPTGMWWIRPRWGQASIYEVSYESGFFICPVCIKTFDLDLDLDTLLQWHHICLTIEVEEFKHSQ